MPFTRLIEALANRRQISISTIGRRSGRTITLPVWFVAAEETIWLLPVHGSRTHWYRNLARNPSITVAVKGERQTLHARVLKGGSSVRKVIQAFREKYTPEIVERLYPGTLDVAVKVIIRPTPIRAASK